MFKNKSTSGKNNICGSNISIIRQSLGISQRELADRLQRSGLDIGKNGIQRIESGKGFVTDIELFHLCSVLDVDYNDLIDSNDL